MIRKVFLLFAVLVVAGLGPALAQDIFIKKNTGDSEPGAKPTLFNKPKTSAAGLKQSVVKYKDKIKVKNLKAKSFAKVKSLEEIKELGLKPTNAEEIQFYAQAHRAAAQDLMYKRREALMVHLKKEREKLEEQIANQSQSAVEIAGNSSGGGTAKVGKVQKTASKKPKLYVAPKEDKSLPTKVFTGYR